MDAVKASVAVVKKFIDAGSSKAASMSEMQEFWKSLTDEEKIRFTHEATLLMPNLVKV